MTFDIGGLMNMGALITNLAKRHGLLPAAIQNLANSERDVVVLGSGGMGSDKGTALYSSPLRINSRKINEFIRNVDIKPKKLVIQGSELASEYYCFNIAIRMFLGSDGTFNAIEDFNECCIFTTLKAAHIAISRFECDHETLASFRVYEKINTSFLNEYRVDASLIETDVDTVNVIKPSNNCPLFNKINLLKVLIEGGLVPVYEMDRICEYTQLLDLFKGDNECLSQISEEEASSFIEIINNILIQETVQVRPVKLCEYTSFGSRC